MREIEFRGKRIDNGEWVYGFYSPLIWYPTREQDPSIKNYNGSDIKIKPETLGQYIGLTDKNGNKIFEGDIVKATYNGENEKYYKVIFYNGGYKMKSIGCQTVYDYSIHDEHPDFEVIGNIYDNKIEDF